MQGTSCQVGVSFKPPDGRPAEAVADGRYVTIAEV